MLIIKKMEDQIGEELHDAKKYIKCAIKYKDEHRDLADLYYQLSQEEMTHADKLHKMVVHEIENYRKKEGEPPAEMLAIYNYLHEKEIDKAKEVKTLWDMYKA